MNALLSPQIPLIVDRSLGLVCVEALKIRGLVSEAAESEVAMIILENSGDPVLAAQELYRKGLIERHNEAVVGEFIKRTVRRRAWRVSRPVAVGRAAHSLHIRQRLAWADGRPSSLQTVGSR